MILRCLYLLLPPSSEPALGLAAAGWDWQEKRYHPKRTHIRMILFFKMIFFFP